VSTCFSYEASDAETFSMYSCSCCKAKPPSTACSHPSVYDNLTSVSQRPSNNGSLSLTTEKLKVLENELRKEREDRLSTQKELELIRKRQMFLLSKLTQEERDQLQKLMNGS
jgi:hypothetical protein